MTTQAWGEVATLLVCIFLSGAASATETAMTSVGRLRVRHLAEEGTRSAKTLQRLHADPNRFLSTVLVVNTVALIVASSSTTLLGIAYLPTWLGLWGDFGVSLLLSIFLLIFAEVTPKTLAIRNAERLSLIAAPVVDALSRFLRPVLWLTTIIARGITGGRAARAPFLTEEELLTLLHVSEEQGVIEEEEREMIHGSIEIGDKSVREVMVPRTDMTAIEEGATLQEIVRLIRLHKHTRLPVYKGDMDHMSGLIHVKDILLYYAGKGQQPFEISKVLRPIQFCPEQKKVDELLHQMQTEKVHMMVVLDEYGGTAGLVTLEDLLEEIVGEIRDEYDAAEEDPIRLLSETEALVDARHPMGDLNDQLELGIKESTDYDSVGGYVYSQLGTVPEVGTDFEAGGVTWKVETVDGQRILQVRLLSRKPWPDEALVAAGFDPVSRDTGLRVDPDDDLVGHAG